MTAKTEGAVGRRGAQAAGRGPARAVAAEQLSRADRVARGKDARAVAPLESHAEFAAGESRDPVGLLLDQATSRVPELVPVRHGRMLVSAFTFYRGAALPMAADLAGTPASGCGCSCAGMRKVVGVGSVGTRAWVLLMDACDGVEPLFLQAKEAQPSVLAGYCGRSQYANQGERVVAGQHLMQAQSDIFLGWTRVPNPVDGVDRDFYVRQLRDWKFSVPIEQMLPVGMTIYSRLCGWTLARAHARSGDRIALAAYLGRSAKLDKAQVSTEI